MLLALSVVFFFIGFVVAAVLTSRLKEARDAFSSLNDGLKNFCHMFKPCATSAQDSRINDDQYLVPADDTNLLTKYSRRCPLTSAPPADVEI